MEEAQRTEVNRKAEAKAFGKGKSVEGTIFSPDLNPLDYSIWSLLEADMNAEEHNSVESFKNAISEAFERLPMEVINQAVDNWMKRLDAVIKAKGGHFE